MCVSVSVCVSVCVCVHLRLLQYMKVYVFARALVCTWLTHSLLRMGLAWAAARQFGFNEGDLIYETSSYCYYHYYYYYYYCCCYYYKVRLSVLRRRHHAHMHTLLHVTAAMCHAVARHVLGRVVLANRTP